MSNNNKSNFPKGFKPNSVTILLLGLLLWAVVMSFITPLFTGQTVTEVKYSDFWKMLQAGSVIEVELDDPLTFTAKDSKGVEKNYKTPYNAYIQDAELQPALKEKEVAYKARTSNFFTETLLPNLLSIVIMFALLSLLMRSLTKRMGGNSMSFGKSNAKVYVQSKPGKSFKDVAGQDEAKDDLSEIVDFLHDPSKYSEIGAVLPKGVLLVGPPGTGKTLLAQAVAGEANVPFFSMSGSEFVELFVGMGASKVRDLFKQAKEKAPCIVFIDEIDAIGKKRARNSSASNDERDQTLNALLTEMSGFHDNQGIVVIGATNRLDTLDEALLRPGRFDRQIEIGLPDVNSREKILALHTKNKPLSDDIDLKYLAKSTVGFSGAMLENLLNEAAISAANDKKPIISQSNIDRAFYTVLAGAPKTDLSYISKREREITAYHEAGHALATKLLLPENYISKVTIIPSVRGAGGFNLSIPKDTMYQSGRQILGNIKILLAGRAAEELIFGLNEITTGASNDIQKASSLIMDYTNKYGMDPDIGLFSTHIFSEGIDKELIKKCRALISKLYQETRELLENNLDALNSITKELLEKESLNGEEIDKLIA